ncbi:MAG: hypothetical protein FJ134_09550 [Deltaproteobacteria bacterium]|nr:hypothetical protein [Deltaproteobacteria bacterium]
MFALKVLQISILGGLLLLGAVSGPAPAQDKPGEEKIASPVASPDVLPRVLAEGAAAQPGRNLEQPPWAVQYLHPGQGPGAACQSFKLPPKVGAGFPRP